MTPSEEIICTAALILFMVLCGNVHLAGKINMDEKKYEDSLLFDISATSQTVEEVYVSYRVKTKEVFGFKG